MEYLKVEWIHSTDEYPILLYSEIDDKRMEVRKVERYRDGKVGLADCLHSTGDTQLGSEPVPSFEEIAADPQFVPEQITRQEFETVWDQCLRNRSISDGRNDQAV